MSARILPFPLALRHAETGSRRPARDARRTRAPRLAWVAEALRATYDVVSFARDPRVRGTSSR